MVRFDHFPRAYPRVFIWKKKYIKALKLFASYNIIRSNFNNLWLGSMKF